MGRLLLEAELERRPVVVPIWIEGEWLCSVEIQGDVLTLHSAIGFDEMMPEPRNPPRWLPRPGAHLRINFGDAIEHEPELSSLLSGGIVPSSEAPSTLERFRIAPPPSSFPPSTPLVAPPGGAYAAPLPGSRSERALKAGADEPDVRARRSAVAARLREQLLLLGERTGGEGVRSLVHRVMREDGTLDGE